MSDPAERLAPVESPCVGICSLGPKGLCVGCFRSGEEIASWLSYSPERRQAIMDGLANRAQSLFDDE